MNAMEQDRLFERLWNGEATMEEWTATVSGGATRAITDDIIAIHTGYLFGNATAIRTGDGLVLVDTGSRETASHTLGRLRQWDNAPVHTIVYTHGHIDHTWGARLLDQEADARGIARPRIIAHRNVLTRFERYDATHGLNSLVMGRQFNQPGYTFPDNHRRPDHVYDDTLSVMVGGVRIELVHGRGETDDATFVWLPENRILISGDFVIWVFPECGQPTEGSTLCTRLGRRPPPHARPCSGRAHPRSRPGGFWPSARRADTERRGGGAGKPGHADGGLDEQGGFARPDTARRLRTAKSTCEAISAA